MRTNHLKLISLLLLIMLSFSSSVMGKHKADTDTSGKARLHDLAKYAENLKKEPVSPSFTPDPIKQKLNEFSLQDTIWVFKWQHFSTVVIFIIVISIVLMGLYLSYRQFEFNMEMTRKQHEDAVLLTQKKERDPNPTRSQARATEEKKAASEEYQTTSTFEVTKGGIKINSAVIGLIILAIAIAFFFLYLRFVYPIHIIKPY